jgi:general secretion pathway protein A
VAEADNFDECYLALGLSEPPFRITPDTQFFFPHSQYLSALGHLLRPFGLAETTNYIRHRLDSVRTNNHLKFTHAAPASVHYCRRGVPRRINLICDRALLAVYADRSCTVTAPTVRRAAREVLGMAAHE